MESNSSSNSVAENQTGKFLSVELARMNRVAFSREISGLIIALVSLVGHSARAAEIPLRALLVCVGCHDYEKQGVILGMDPGAGERAGGRDPQQGWQHETVVSDV